MPPTVSVTISYGTRWGAMPPCFAFFCHMRASDNGRFRPRGVASGCLIRQYVGNTLPPYRACAFAFHYILLPEVSISCPASIHSHSPTPALRLTVDYAGDIPRRQYMSRMPFRYHQHTRAWASTVIHRRHTTPGCGVGQCHRRSSINI